ncbi:hypothetical protein [Methylobacterium frigidaeris]|nr:hypothetical protein [Methylobacterium frigidaeris]
MSVGPVWHLAYTLLTRHEGGLLPVLSMRAHLALDAASALSFVGAGLLMREERREDRALLVAMTDPGQDQPATEPDRRVARSRPNLRDFDPYTDRNGQDFGQDDPLDIARPDDLRRRMDREPDWQAEVVRIASDRARLDAVAGGTTDTVAAAEAETPPETLRRLSDASSRMPAAGPHAYPRHMNPDATPGTGALLPIGPSDDPNMQATSLVVSPQSRRRGPLCASASLENPRPMSRLVGSSAGWTARPVRRQGPQRGAGGAMQDECAARRLPEGAVGRRVVDEHVARTAVETLLDRQAGDEARARKVLRGPEVLLRLRPGPARAPGEDYWLQGSSGVEQRHRVRYQRELPVEVRDACECGPEPRRAVAPLVLARRATEHAGRASVEIRQRAVAVEVERHYLANAPALRRDPP